MKKALIITILLVIALFLGVALAQAKPGNPNQASDIERGVFVHYPHAKGQAKGAGATGDEVNNFKYSGVHWLGSNPSVPYWINPVNPSNLNPDDVVGVVQSAFSEWMHWETAADDNNEISFVYRGPTNEETLANLSMNGLNTVSFEPLSSVYPNAIAVTFYWYYRGSKGLVETDTVFNSDLPWSVTAEPKKYDLQNIATHEFGHWLLLGDLYSPRDWALTMYGYGYLGETIKSTLGRGDKTGINRIY